MWRTTNGPQWLSHQGGWADLEEHKRCDLCEGVEVDADNRPTAIRLYETGMTGYLPKSMGRLKRLQILNLRGNEIGGELPSNLGLCRNMKVVRLNANNFTGELPMSLYLSENIEELNLRNNSFSGVIMDSIASMQRLNYLDLSQNHFTGDVPGTLEFCELLTYCDLTDNQFGGDFGPTELLTKKGLKIGISGNPWKIKGLYTDGEENYMHVERRMSQVDEGFGGFRNKNVGAQVW